MHAVRFAPAVLATLVSCNTTRKQECDQFLAAMQPLATGAPSVQLVDTATRAIAAIQFQDQPLREYASSTKATLTTLSETIRLQATPSPPDGTDDLVKTKLKEARGELGDVTRYCAE